MHYALISLASVVVAVALAAVPYQAPVAAPVVDPFRAPSAPWAPGNRGIEYATEPGTRVGAAADGAVVFAGMVGGSLHVVVRHRDGVRTSYSFLRAVLVHRGDTVTRGEPVGITGSRFHFGARIGDEYVDPVLLFGGAGPRRVHLVPDRDVPRSPPHPATLQRAGSPGETSARWH